MTPRETLSALAVPLDIEPMEAKLVETFRSRLAIRAEMGWLPLACFSRRQGDRPLQKIAPCLWFDTEAVEAANFYVSVFKNSKIIRVARYPNEG